MLDAIAAFFFAFVKDMRGKFDIALWPAELLIKILWEKYPIIQETTNFCYFITGCILYGWTFEAYLLLI